MAIVLCKSALNHYHMPPLGLHTRKIETKLIGARTVLLRMSFATLSPAIVTGLKVMRITAQNPDKPQANRVVFEKG